MTYSDKTENKKIFKTTYWGNFSLKNRSDEDLKELDEIVKNRNNFINDYNIKNIVNKRPVKLHEYIKELEQKNKLDHVEIYLTNDDKYLILNSPYDPNIKTSKEKKEKLKELNINDHLKQYIMDTQVARGVITKSKNIDDVKPGIDFIKKIDFSHEDAFEFMKPFLSKKDAFIFLDPPYLFSNNETYFPQNKEEGDMDMTDYYIKFVDILKDKKTNAKIMLVINDLKNIKMVI